MQHAKDVCQAFEFRIWAWAATGVQIAKPLQTPTSLSLAAATATDAERPLQPWRFATGHSLAVTQRKTDLSGFVISRKFASRPCQLPEFRSSELGYVGLKRRI